MDNVGRNVVIVITQGAAAARRREAELVLERALLGVSQQQQQQEKEKEKKGDQKGDQKGVIADNGVLRARLFSSEGDTIDGDAAAAAAATGGGGHVTHPNRVQNASPTGSAAGGWHAEGGAQQQQRERGAQQRRLAGGGSELISSSDTDMHLQEIAGLSRRMAEMQGLVAQQQEAMAKLRTHHQRPPIAREAARLQHIDAQLAELEDALERQGQPSQSHESHTSGTGGLR